MGRFYKTSQPESIDFMYQLPQQVMLGAIQMNDAQVDNQYQQAAILNDKLMQIKYLEPDRERTQEIINSYQSQVDELTKNLQSNPDKWRNQLPVIRDLARKLDNDFSRGEIANIQSNYSTYQNWDATTKDLLKQGKITPEQYEKSRNYFLSDFANKKGTSYDPNTKKGNSIYTENIFENPDINTDLQKWLKDFKADGWKQSTRQVNIGGNFITENGFEKEGKWVSEVEVYKSGLNLLMGDPRYTGYFNQGHNLGYLNGIYDNNGEFINPILGVDKSGKLQFNPKSYLAKPLEAAILRESYKEDSYKSFQDYKGANPFSLQQQKADLDDRNSERKYKRENPEDITESVSSLIIGQNKQILDPKEFNLPTINKTLIQLENKLKSGEQLTTPELTQYNNLKKAKENIENKSKEVLIKAGMTETEFEKYKPYLDQNFNTPKSNDPAGLFRVKNDISELKGLYDPKIWKPVLVKSGGSGLFGVKADNLYTFELTDEGKNIKKISEKYSSTQKDITKLIQDQNTYTTPYFAINQSPVELDANGNPKPKTKITIGDKLAELAIALLQTNDANIVNPNENPEWSKPKIKVMQQRDYKGIDALYPDKKLSGQLTSLKDLSSITGIPEEQLFIPTAMTPNGSTKTNTQYLINTKLLKSKGIYLEDAEKGGQYNYTPELISYKTNANSIMKQIFGPNPSVEVQRVLNRDDEVFNFVETNISTMYKNYGTYGTDGNLISKSFQGPGGLDNYIITINQLDDNSAQFDITDSKTNKTRKFPVIQAGMDSQGNFYPASDIISNQITNVLNFIKEENLKEKYNNNGR